jgi:SAM-dependent methyltransferase
MAPLRAPARIRRVFARGAYEAVSFGYRMTLRLDDDSAHAQRDVVDSSFMNYGYHDPAQAPFELSEQLETARNQIALYRHVLAAADPAGKDVVEVGCGRGGGAAWIAEELAPASLLGIDLSPSAIAFCRRRHRAPNLRFAAATAEALPLEDASVDIVVNVESSHMYDMDRFLAEVARVLRPGGLLCWADSRLSGQIPSLERSFAESGLHLIDRHDIAGEVMAALADDGEHRTQIVCSAFPVGTHTVLKTIMGVPGTALFEGYETGALHYESATLRKPAS